MAATSLVKVDLIADLACPWCYLGLLRFERARAALPARLRWRAFLLNPHLPEDGVPRDHYLARKFGGPERARTVYERIARSARADGVRLGLDRITRTPNTVRAHRLVIEAERHGLGEVAIHALFRAFLVEGRDIGRIEELAAIGAELGLADAAAITRFLEGDRLASEVLHQHRAATEAGIGGVPMFVFGQRHAIAGAQPPETLRNLLELAAGIGERGAVATPA